MIIKRGNYIISIFVLCFLLTIITFFFGCGGAGCKPCGTVTISILMEVDRNVAANVQSNATFNIRYKPILNDDGDGFTGNASEQEHCIDEETTFRDKTFFSTVRSTSLGRWGSVFNPPTQCLRTGIWEISISGHTLNNEPWVVENCIVEVKSGLRTLNFTVGKPGCSQLAYEYP